MRTVENVAQEEKRVAKETAVDGGEVVSLPESRGASPTAVVEEVVEEEGGDLDDDDVVAVSL